MKAFIHRLQVWWLRHKPTRRRFIQLYAALLYNANIKGFIKGEIFTGLSKGVCVPGLNCYSCPGAIGACPLGSLQSAINNQNKSSLYYVVGILLLYGLIFGRTICGWLCPVGLFQELAYKIRSPKLPKSTATRVLSYLKYVILALFVIIIPLMYSGILPLPAFCKYICPAGIFEGSFPLLSHPNNTADFLKMLGEVFNWKFFLFAGIFVACIFIYRVFCRFLCPLGAIYSLFNKFCMIGVKVNKDTCTNCGLCVKKCKMDIKKVGDHECINCGECISVCPTKAIQWKGKPFEETAKENTLTETTSLIEKEPPKKDKNKTLKIITQVSAVVVLVCALVYANFFNNSNRTSSKAEIGQVCENFSLETYKTNDDGTVSLSENITIESLKGKVTYINFWSTTCVGCIAEMPYFEQFYDQYKDEVNVVAVHTIDITKPVEEFIYGQENPEFNKDSNDSDLYWSEFEITFAQDNKDNPFKDYFTSQSAIPLTIVLDKEGIIKEITFASMNVDKLISFYNQYK